MVGLGATITEAARVLVVTPAVVKPLVLVSRKMSLAL